MNQPGVAGGRRCLADPPCDRSGASDVPALHAAHARSLTVPPHAAAGVVQEGWGEGEIVRLIMRNCCRRRAQMPSRTRTNPWRAPAMPIARAEITVVHA